MYVFCVFASVPPSPSNPFPPLFHVIYCKRLGLLRLGVSILLFIIIIIIIMIIMLFADAAAIATHSGTELQRPVDLWMRN